MKGVVKSCCDMMKMVLGRARPDDRLGLMIETLFRVRDGAPRDTIVIRFRKAPKGDKTEFAGATLAEINYCPWCGKQSHKAPSHFKPRKIMGK